MRRIGTLSSEREAQAFSDYLLTLQLDTQVSGSDGAWDVWLLDEDRLEQGRSELEAFRSSPNAPRYVAAAGAAKAKRDAELESVLSAARQQIDLRERWERPLWLQAPVTCLTVGLCMLVTLLCGFGDNHDVTAALQIQSTTVTHVGGYDYVSIPRRPLADVAGGQVWRLVTPIFIHLGFIHLLGNTMMMMMLGRMIESERGSWRLLWCVLLTAIVSNLAQNAYAGPNFGGLSGVVYGLFGYVWLMSWLDPRSGLQLSRETTIMMLVWLIVCTTGRVGPVANTAHFVGLGMGLALAAAEVLYRRSRA